MSEAVQPGETWGNMVFFTIRGDVDYAPLAQFLMDMAARLEADGAAATLEVGLYVPGETLPRVIVPDVRRLTAQAEEIARLTEANASLLEENAAQTRDSEALRARIVELENRPPAGPQPLYQAVVVSPGVNVRDERGDDLHEFLPPGVRVAVYSEGSAGGYTERGYIDQPEVGRNVWLNNLKREA